MMLSKIIILSILAVAFLYELYFYFRYILIVPIYEHRRAKRLTTNDQQPGVSVILCAHNEAEIIRSLKSLWLTTALRISHKRY